MDVLHIFLNPSLKNPNKTHKTKQQCLLRRSYYYYCYEAKLWSASVDLNETKIRVIYVQWERPYQRYTVRDGGDSPYHDPHGKNYTSWLSSFLFVIYSHDVVPTFSLSSYFGSFEILLTWYLCVGFSRSQ